MRNLPTDFFRYLPVSDRDRQWGLYVTAGGFNAIAPGQPYPRPGHPALYAYQWSHGRILPEYQALYITRGAGEFESRPSGRRRIQNPSLILLFPGVWHRYRPLPRVGWDEYWVSFNGPHADRLVEQGFFSPQEPILKTGSDDVLLHAYATLLDRLRSEPVGFQQLLAAGVMEIVASALAAVRAHGTGTRMHHLVREAKAAIESQADASPAIDKLAASLGLSPTHFYRVFKEHTGLSPHQYLLQERIHRAKQMLHGTSMNTKEIAAALAFQTPFHFSNVFKQKTGMSPTAWRKMAQGSSAKTE
jgi:AraC-like DNA-binding protein